MLLLAGLGNPGEQYRNHRHNIGFRVVDAIAERAGFGAARRQFNAEICKGVFGGVHVTMMKPLTFMNESGKAIGQWLRYYKQPCANLIVFHDEIDLAAGKLRVRRGGGVAGHNGLRSIKAHCGDDFRRVRIGIGHPGHSEAVQRWVLGDFGAKDDLWLAPMINACAQWAHLLIQAKEVEFMNQVTLAIRKAAPVLAPAKTVPTQKI